MEMDELAFLNSDVCSEQTLFYCKSYYMISYDYILRNTLYPGTYLLFMRIFFSSSVDELNKINIFHAITEP